jgi:hypothetical protein
MPKFGRSQCPICMEPRSSNGFACWCPANHRRAFKQTAVASQPPSMVSRVVQIVMPQFYVDVRPVVFGLFQPDLDMPYVDPAPHIVPIDPMCYEGSMPRVLQMSAMGISTTSACASLTTAS